MGKSLQVGSVHELWRYPVKSMLGEKLDKAAVTERGVQGDRVLALIDIETGHVVSAKNSRRWPSMFAFQAHLVPGSPMRVDVTLSDGQVISESTGNMDAILSERLGRKVRLTSNPPAHPVLEQYSPNLEGLPGRDTETTVKMLPASFFDEAPVHLLTTSTLHALQSCYPNGRFDTQRFRPNVVIDAGISVSGFLENDWNGRIVTIGPQVRLAVTSLCSRCVMTTLPQQGLPQDLAILRTVVQHNRGMVGVLATVVTPGSVCAGDTVDLEE
ncbi:MAG: MOSC domain-containing protein [Nitrospirota bacterium]|nr:MOSC domain-containing protein [Nitrospirota bacterium]MDP2383646.1 MOSC domain-containing protein [Nitrospirota bacterium]MDP3599283.1 MOSC domain-containing protein [Nitrospirota bacterium]